MRSWFVGSRIAGFQVLEFVAYSFFDQRDIHTTLNQLGIPGCADFHGAYIFGLSPQCNAVFQTALQQNKDRNSN